MSKELPYFKFYCSEWDNGNISLEPYDVQGLFINICTFYWSRECNVSLKLLNKKFRGDSDLIEQLFKIEVIKKKNENLSIKFLDEQLRERKKIAKRNKINGLKGGRPKTQSVKSGLAKHNPNITNIEEKRREEKKERNIKEILDYLNNKTGKQYKVAKGLQSRFDEGYTVEDAKKVIDNKVSHWLNDPEMKKYLRPETLFSTKFDSYLNEEKQETYKDGEWLEGFDGCIQCYKWKGKLYNTDGTVSKEWELVKHGNTEIAQPL